ncbi:phenol 2-monooxygenase P4 subunit [Panacagrimonas perspica]|uniref:Phenol 2-monooxygenase P4 subunit n=1 Tax=Panacagrimonas perspica TaxID=381431 RepID=A0A4V3US64_9GAMM|nr:phenol hydroxylase subunit P4 [Panacagrimonas perspica]TDU32597.1 phenol 2-monooxygenase P4 subunit [Panacagrimonas perspica]THD05491.1 phenol hydroxylase [Panacagrimonas perspica]
MSVVALKPGYTGEIKDRVENFHGQQLLYIGWEDHLMFCAPLCIPVPPTLPFGALTAQIIPDLYAAHPDASAIDWSKVEWFSSSQPFTPDLSKSLADNGLGHKASLRFRTPGLTGIKGSCS